MRTLFIDLVNNMLLRNMKIALRSAAGFSLIGFIVMVLGALSLYQMHEMSSKSDEVDKKWLPSILALEDVQRSVDELRLNMFRTLLTIHVGQQDINPSAMFESRQKISKAIEQYSSDLQTDEERSAFKHMKTVHDQYIQLQDTVLGLARKGDT